MMTWDDLPHDIIKAIMSTRMRLMLQDAMTKHARKEREKKLAWAEYDLVLKKACGRSASESDSV